MSHLLEDRGVYKYNDAGVMEYRRSLMIATRGVTPWMHRDKKFDPDTVLGEDATTLEMWTASGMADLVLREAQTYGDREGHLARFLGVLADPKLDAKILRRLALKLPGTVDLIEVNPSKLIWREPDNKQISVMGKDFAVNQIGENWEILDSLIEEGEIRLESCGSLREGAGSFMTAKIVGDPLKVVDGDVMDRFLICCDGYDGARARTFLAALVMVVCANTEAAALADAKDSGLISKQRHTKGMKGRVDDVRKALRIATKSFDDYAALGQRMALVSMPDSEVKAFHKRLIFGKDTPIPASLDDWNAHKIRQYAELGTALREGRGHDIEGRKGTVWGAYQGVTDYVNHIKRHRSSTTKDRTEFTLFGNGAKIIADARQHLTEYYHLAA